jgi:hypothetical protein
MKKLERHAAESLVSVHAFLKSNPEVAALADTPAAQQLEAAIASLKANLADQTSAGLDTSVRRQHVDDLGRTLVQDYMKPAAQFARRSLKGAADYAALTRVSRARGSRKLATDARAMATAATPVTSAFASAKFDPQFLTQLGALADELDAALDARTANNARGVGATRGISTAIKSGREAVGMLDPVVTRLLKGNKLLAVWQSAKHVRANASSTVLPNVAPTVLPVVPAASASPASPVAPVATHTQEVKAA